MGILRRTSGGFRKGVVGSEWNMATWNAPMASEVPLGSHPVRDASVSPAERLEF